MKSLSIKAEIRSIKHGPGILLNKKDLTYLKKIDKDVKIAKYGDSFGFQFLLNLQPFVAVTPVGHTIVTLNSTCGSPLPYRRREDNSKVINNSYGVILENM